MLFQPIEEMLRVYFSTTLSATRPTKEAHAAASRLLQRLLQTQLALSVLIVTFGPPYLPLILRIVLPSAYLATSAPDVLAAWTYYIPVLAINGALEAFMASVATSQDLKTQSR